MLVFTERSCHNTRNTHVKYQSSRTHCLKFIFKIITCLSYFIVLVLSFILNSTTVIGKIKEMPQSLFYHIQCYITMDYNKWYTSLLLTNVKKSMHLKFKIMSITCSFHVSDVVLTFYISYKHVRNQI